MAYTGKQIAHSFTAGEDLSGDQYKPVFVNSDGTIYNDDNSGARHFLGILQDKPESGVAGTVCLFGISKVSVSGSTTTGAAFTTGSTHTPSVSCWKALVPQVLQPSSSTTAKSLSDPSRN